MLPAQEVGITNSINENHAVSVIKNLKMVSTTPPGSLLNVLHTYISSTGTCSSLSRQEAKEEVVKGQRYINSYHPAPSSLSGLTDFQSWHKLTLLPLVKDKANHAVILDKATSDKLNKDVQSYRLITVATLVDRLKINGSLARKCLTDLEEKGQIKKVVGHSKLNIYSEFSALPLRQMSCQSLLLRIQVLTMGFSEKCHC